MLLKVINCTQQLQVRENVVGFEKALGTVKVIKDQIQYRSQSLLNLARGYFSQNGRECVIKFVSLLHSVTSTETSQLCCKGIKARTDVFWELNITFK